MCTPHEIIHASSTKWLISVLLKSLVTHNKLNIKHIINKRATNYYRNETHLGTFCDPDLCINHPSHAYKHTKVYQKHARSVNKYSDLLTQLGIILDTNRRQTRYNTSLKTPARTIKKSGTLSHPQKILLRHLQHLQLRRIQREK